MHFVDKSRAKNGVQYRLARLLNLVLDSRWQPPVSFVDCRQIDIRRIPSHLVPHWHCIRDRLLKVAGPGLSPLRSHTRQRETCLHTQRASFPCALRRARLPKPSLLLFFRLYDGRHPLGTLAWATLAAWLAQKSCK